ncbi:secretoglobin family 1D member 2-like [Canis lupus baileyi]|uniref:secretoglobin family 1D member 2-like n=1 Tax=Canis lupus baileyi TaxID=143281 RepID=UPI003B96BCF0
MRLSLSVLLVTLALCCYEANGIVCPSLGKEMIAFLFEHEALYKPHLQLAYNPPEAALNAKLQVKSCTDKIPIVQRKLIAGVLEKILVKCIF